MARLTGVSVTSLSRAAAGERLPSATVLRAYARACEADPDEWELRLKSAAEEDAGTREAARELAGADDAAASPYRGLSRFEPGDRALFFGRDRLVGELRELVREQRFAAVFGASGSGKSSLLRAGLVPVLRDGAAQLGRPAVVRILTPGERPATDYGRLLAPEDGEPDSWVIVDQFEEAFTLCRDRAERTRFIDLLLAAREPASRLHAVIAMRADFYGQCAEHPGLAEALRHSGLLVGPMNPAELREAVTGPATAAALVVERELTARIVEEVVEQPGALPMLSHALLETWRRRRGRILTLAAYEAAGGVSGAIAATAERVYGELLPAQAGTARHLLLRLIAPGEGTPDTRRAATRAELDEWSDPELPVVLERLAAARLLAIDGQSVELAHEALITGWPRLGGWIDEDRERLREHRALGEAARTWLDLGRDPGALYRGTRLDRAAQLFAPRNERNERDTPRDEHENGRDRLTATERAFLTAALDARAADQRAAARTRRRTRRLAATLSALLATALVIGLIAWQQHRTEVRDSEDTAARRVAEVAATLRTTDPHTALLLSLAAWRIAALPETRAALLGTVAQPEQDAFTDPSKGDDLHRVLVDSGRVLLSHSGRTWHSWNTVTHREIASGRLPAPASGLVVAGQDGHVLALDAKGGQRLWDLYAHRWTTGAQPGSDDTVLTFTDDPHSYLWSSVSTPRIQLRAVSGGRLLLQRQVLSETNLVTTPDGRLVATCPVSGPIEVWDTVTRRALPGGWTSSADRHCGDSASSLRLDAAGHRLAAVSDSGVRVWDTGSGRLLADLADQNVTDAVFSPDGDFLATADAADVAVRRLSAPDVPVLRHAFNGRRLSGDLAWDPHRPVLRYLEGGTVHTLDLGAAVTSAWRTAPLRDVLLSPDGRTVATAEETRTGYAFRLLDPADGRLLRTLPAPPLPTPQDGTGPLSVPDALPLLAFSPDGTTFGYGVSAMGRIASSQQVNLWDLGRRRVRTTLDLTGASGAAVEGIALGPAGRILAAARSNLDEADDGGELWDTARHRRTAAVGRLSVAALGVRPDGHLLVSGNLRVDLPSGAATARTLGLGQEVTALAFSADGSRVALGDASGRVAVWDGGLDHRLGVLPNTFTALRADGTPETVSALAFAPDGTTLAVGGDSGSLQLWDIDDQQVLGSPTTPGESIFSLAFAPDGATLYAVGPHAPVQRYPVTPAAAATRVCATADHTLTAAQWHAYIPDAAYRDICPAA